MNNRTTLKDIANKLGVSKTLVSFVVRNLPDGYGNISVRPELREQIKQLAKEMNYAAHRSARALRTGHSKMIGVISSSSDHPIHFAKQQTICDEITARGYDYLLQEIDYGNTLRMTNAISMMMDYSVEGIVLLDIPTATCTEEHIDFLAASKIPAAGCGGTANIQGPCVKCAFYEAGYQLGKAVVEKGRRKFYAVTQKDFYLDPSGPGRIQGMQEACREIGKVQILMSRSAMRFTQTDIEIGYMTTKEFLDTLDADTLFYSNDFMAFGGLRALAEAGLRVPEDICVSGFDGIEIARFSKPSLTTAVQPTDKMGTKAVELLFEQLESGCKSEHSEITIAADIVLRESTGH